MVPGTYNIPDHYRNDTWQGLVFNIVANGVPVDLTGAAVKISFRRHSKDNSVEDTRTGAGQAAVTDGPNGEITFYGYVVTYVAATYYYDLQVTTSGGDVITYVAGTWTIIEDVTK